MAEAEEQELVEKAGDTVSDDEDTGATEKTDAEGEEGGVESIDSEEHAAESGEDSQEADSVTQAPRRDPTEGMTPEQAVDYWRKQATHFKGDYYKEKTKRQTYEKQYGAGGLISKALSENGNGEAKQELKTEYENVIELRDDILREAETRAERRLTYRQQMDRFTESEALARKRYGDAYGEYVEVASEFIKDNDWMKGVLLKSKDGGEAVKHLAELIDPSLKDRDRKQIESRTRGEMADKIQEAEKKAITLKGNGGAVKTVKKLAKDLTDDEMEAEIARVKGF